MEGLINTGSSGPHSVHRLLDAMRCPRMHRLNRDAQAEGLDLSSRAQGWGTLLHVGLAHLYAGWALERDGVVSVGGQVVQKPSAFLTPQEAIEAVAQQRGYENAQAAVVQALQEYRTYYCGDPHEYLVLAIEHPFHLVLPGGVHYSQKADLVLQRRRDKLVFILDYKRSYALISKTLYNYAIDLQMVGYRCIGLKRWPDLFGGVWLQRVKPSEGAGDPWKAQRPTCFDRRPLPGSPGSAARFVRTIYYWDKVARMAEKTKDPMDVPGAQSEAICYGKYVCRWYERCLS